MVKKQSSVKIIIGNLDEINNQCDKIEQKQDKKRNTMKDQILLNHNENVISKTNEA